MLFLFSIFVSSFQAFPAVPDAKDDKVSLKEDSSVTVEVLLNDTDVAAPGNRKLSVIEGPKDGETKVENDTDIVYTPDTDFYGEDSFTYRIENIGEGSSTAEVEVEVEPVNDPVLPVRDVLTTRVNTPVKVVLKATDKDIKPEKPYLHPVEFEIVKGPSHGELTGDPGRAVYYRSPHEAFVELEYSPDPDYTGTDSITFSAEDPEGLLETAVLRIEVKPEEAPPATLSGYLGTGITMEEGADYNLAGFGTSVVGIYRYDSYEVRARAGFSLDEMDSLSFRTEIPLQGLELESDLDFDPSEDQPFEGWRAEAGFYHSGIDYRYTFNLEQDPEDIYHELRARWAISGISFSGSTRFEGADPKFEEADLGTRFSWPDCDLSVSTDISFTDEGFDEFSVDIGDLPLLYGVYLGLETNFSEDEKEVEPQLYYRSEWVDCFRIAADLETNDEENRITGLSITEINFRTTLNNGVNLRIDTSLSEPEGVANEISLSGAFYAGYDVPGRWRISNYLAGEKNGELFGWQESELKVIVPLAEDLDIETVLTVQDVSPHWILRLGGEIFW